MNTRKVENMTAMKLLDTRASMYLSVANGQIVKNGEKVMDLQSGIEGTLTFGIWYWTVKYDDGVENIVVDASKLVKI